MLIARWNATVKDTDDVYILGDFIYKAKKPAIWYLKQLKGRKHLIQGNHDFHILKDENLMKEFVSTDKMMYVKDGIIRSCCVIFRLQSGTGTGEEVGIYTGIFIIRKKAALILCRMSIGH